jgi:hypothetical protein
LVLQMVVAKPGTNVFDFLNFLAKKMSKNYISTTKSLK